jgi:Holliday junction DNA helicase RuvB
MTLRPKNFDGIIGQDNVKACLKIAIESARKRGDVLNHSLFLGPAGTGKTTLALATAHELGSNILLANGGNISKLKDVTPYLSRLNQGDVLFIDEVHRVNKRVQESLFTVMEDFRLDISKGCQSIHYKPFTIIGATTEAGMLLRPFYDRFIHQFQLENYSLTELSKLIGINCDKLSVCADNGAITNIAKRSRYTPRIANSLLQWCRDYAVSRNTRNLTSDIVDVAMKLKKIDKNGLDRADRQYIMALKRAGKPLGLQTIVATTGLSRETIEHQIEPFLFKLGIINKTNRGREIV